MSAVELIVVVVIALVVANFLIGFLGAAIRHVKANLRARR